MSAAGDAATGGSPFAPDDERAYRRFREWKFDTAPRAAEDLLVAVADPRAPTGEEIASIRERCRICNMAIYVSRCGDADKTIPLRLGAALGLTTLDANWLADEDGVSSITPGGGDRGDFIPYTDKPIRWHTDGYYNPPDRQIRGMILHCVQPAAEGGENALVDHEIAYCLLRDEDPALVRALFAADAMTIPERSDREGVARPAESGPVFSVDPAGGDLHMRYTARTRSILWRDDAATRAAAGRLQSLLDGGGPWVHRLRMEAGMGLACNNVLHDRAGFRDDPGRPRLLYRARFYERIAGTSRASAAPNPRRGSISVL